VGERASGATRVTPSRTATSRTAGRSGVSAATAAPAALAEKLDRARRARRRGLRRVIWAVGVFVSAPLLLFMAFLLTFAASGDDPLTSRYGASAEALADIPGDMLVLYQEAGAAYGVDWAVLAGIGKLECDHGRYDAAGCNPPGTVNFAGARGPMQFLGSTWRSSAGQHELEVAGTPIPEGEETRGFATDGDGDGIADPWDPADAVHAAGRYLAYHGAPEDYRGAVFAYNRSQAYVNEVMTWADVYRDAAAAPADAAGVIADPGGVDLTTVRGITVHVAIAQPLEQMIGAAERDGITLTGSGYRSTQRQIELRRAHCGSSHYAVYEMPSSQCSPPTARPGASMHERGLAVDFENCSTRSTACYQWLAANAATYGLYNLPSEPWHWSTDGT
jgi:hypothetical protein